MGRPPALTEHQAKEAWRRLAKGESCRSIAKSFNCHHSTISRLQTKDNAKAVSQVRQ